MGLAHNILYQLNSFCITSEKIYTKEKNWTTTYVLFTSDRTKLTLLTESLFEKKKKMSRNHCQLHNTDSLDMQKSLEHFELSLLTSNSDFKLVT